MNKILIVVVLMLLSNLCSAQDILMDKNEIVKITKPTVKALEKFEKRPKKKKRKEKLLKEYNKITETYPLETLLKEQPQSNNNWERKLNVLYIFQYLDDKISKTKSASTFIGTKDNRALIDSISKDASNALYNEGKRIMDNPENEFSHMNAYQSFYRANLISPGYKDCKDLMIFASASGNKTVTFMPLKGFQSRVSKNFSYNSEKGLNVSPSFHIQQGDDNDFFNSLINEPLLNKVGSQLTNNNGLSADWIVDIQWKDLGIPDRVEESKHSRSKEIEENKIKKTVKADVTYRKVIVNIDGVMSLKVDSKISNQTILLKDISGYETFTYIDVSYTGDKRALTSQDLYYQTKKDQPFQGHLPIIDNQIVNVNQYGFDSNQYGSNNQSFDFNSTNSLIKRFYDSILYPQLVNELGYLLNWDYPFLKKE